MRPTDSIMRETDHQISNGGGLEEQEVGIQDQIEPRGDLVRRTQLQDLLGHPVWLFTRRERRQRGRQRKRQRWILLDFSLWHNQAFHYWVKVLRESERALVIEGYYMARLCS